jgi:trigger factor
MWDSRLHSLAHQGISREMLLQITGREEADMLAELKDDAERTLRREAVLTAVVAAEQLQPTEERMLTELAPVAEREGAEPQKLLEDLRSSGREEELRESVAARMAEELIAERASAITPEQAEAREKLWTPEQDAETAGAAVGEAGAPAAGSGTGAGKLWTPTERSSAS